MRIEINTTPENTDHVIEDMGKLTNDEIARTVCVLEMIKSKLMSAMILDFEVEEEFNPKIPEYIEGKATCMKCGFVYPYTRHYKTTFTPDQCSCGSNQWVLKE